MRTKGFKDGLISRGEIRVEIGEKFYTIKSEKHGLILKERRRTINSENNNKRQFIGKHISVPYGYRSRPLDLIKGQCDSNNDNVSYIMDCFSGKEILYDNNLDPDDAELYRYIDYLLYKQ
jgi:hypothetical protein